MDDRQWEDLKRQSLSASENDPLEIPVIYDREKYRGPKAEIVERADFVTFPATAEDISQEHCRGYGKRFYMRRGEIKRKMKEGVYYEDACEELLRKTKKGAQVTNYISSKDSIEGLQRGSQSDDYEMYEIVLRYPLDKDGEKKLLIVYSADAKVILSCMEYPYRVDFYALFRIRKKPKRLGGEALPEELKDMNDEIDMSHNQRNNSRRIVEVPSFKAKKNANKDFDPEAEETRWRPGVIFWLDDPDAFIQMTNQPVDFNSSMAEEDNDMKITSLTMGVEPFSFSGSATPDNPRAPGNKTGMLIQQSNLRMDDPLLELRAGIEDVGEICLSHEYQFGSAKLQYVSTDSSNKQVTKSLQKRLLRKGINMKMHGLSVVMNPDAEFKKWYAYYTFLSKDPIIGQRIKSRWYLLMMALRSGRVQGRDKILPSLEELQKEDVEMKAQVQALAMQKMQQMQQKQKGQGQMEQATNALKLKGMKDKSAVDRAKNKIDMQGLAIKHVKQKKELHDAETGGMDNGDNQAF